MGNRFNWDSWEIVGDNNRTDYLADCSNDTSGTSGTPAPSGIPATSPELSGCARGIPPRIDSFDILPSAQIRITFIGDGIE